jgi:CheY-like chemotaxis protein
MSKILIAEDNPVNRELLREILEAAQHQVFEAGNGQEALARLEELVPDLVLLDINMPLMDGFATIAQIRKHPKLREVPVLAITAYAMKEDRERVLTAGFDGYLPKPVEAAGLLKAITHIVG